MYFSLTVCDLIFLRRRVEYPLGFKALNKTEQASLKLCLKSKDLWFNDAFKGMVLVKRLAVEKLMCVCGFKKYFVV